MANSKTKAKRIQLRKLLDCGGSKRRTFFMTAVEKDKPMSYPSATTKVDSSKSRKESGKKPWLSELTTRGEEA